MLTLKDISIPTEHKYCNLIVDTNECLVDGSCDQICHNTNGSYSCDCVPGYKKMNRTGCQAINGID